MIKKSVGSGDKPYKCPHCFEQWVGVTNRVADRPLDPDATIFANQYSYNTCGMLREQGAAIHRQLNMSDEDYRCRRKWMDAYLSYLEKNKEKEPEPPPDPCDPISKCLPTPPPDLRCALTAMFATCEHGISSARVAEAGQVLEVVPDTTHGPDNIELTAVVQKGCGNHPRWSITGEPERSGTSVSFGARAPAIAKAWVPTIDPQVYVVECSCCNGSASSLKVHAYPLNKTTIIVDAKKFAKVIEALRKGEDVLKRVVKKVGLVRTDWKFTWFQGRLKAEFMWKEHDDLRAFFYYTINLLCEPLVGGELTLELGIKQLLEKVPIVGRKLGDLVDAAAELKAYLRIKGNINLGATLERITPDEKLFVAATGPGIEGEMQVELGVEGDVVGGKVGDLRLEGKAEIAADAQIALDDDGVMFKNLKLEFKGLVGRLRFSILGAFEIREEITLLEGQILAGPEDVRVWTFDE